MTIYDLAKKAGVSTATVSRVVNNKGGVKRETMEHVLQVMREMNFSVNDVARSLAVRSTNTVAMLATDIRENYYVQIAYMVERGLASKGIYSLFGSMGRDARRQIDYVRAMQSKRVSAIVWIGSPANDTELVGALLEVSKSIPVVITNGHLPGEQVYCIQRDDAAGTRLGVDHLIEQGCRRLAFVTDDGYTSDRIKRGVFQDLMEQYAPQGITGQVFTCGYGLDESLAFAGRLYDEGIPYDGLVCTNDVIASGLVKGISDRGLRVPQDKKIVGCDNTFLTKLTTPALTSVDYALEKQGELAVALLGDLLDGKAPPQHFSLITPTLAVRGSTQA